MQTGIGEIGERNTDQIILSNKRLGRRGGRGNFAIDVFAGEGKDYANTKECGGETPDALAAKCVLAHAALGGIRRGISSGRLGAEPFTQDDQRRRAKNYN